MSRYKRTARRFQLEALEGRWAPGGLSGGVLGDRMTPCTGEEIPTAPVAHVVPLVKGGAGGGVIGVAPTLLRRPH
jgi:hypothetical protein